MPGEPTLLPSILVADDDEVLLRAYARVLRTNGYRVETAADGQTALEAFQKRRFDLILSDIDMPGLSGIELLEAVRAHDLDVPVVLVTGTPEVDSTIRAIEHGALRYLVKPVETAALIKVAGDAVRLHRLAKAKRQALTLLGGSHLVGDHAGLVASFGRALDAHYVAYQPIVSWSEKRVAAYEVLERYIWGSEWSEHVNLRQALQQLVSRTRRKLESYGLRDLIHSIPRVGYSWELHNLEVPAT